MPDRDYSELGLFPASLRRNGPPARTAKRLGARRAINHPPSLRLSAATPLNEQAGAQLADVIVSVREQVRDEDNDVTEAALQVAAGPENPKRVMRSLLGQLMHAVVVFDQMCRRMDARTRNRGD
jgi:hypothetical protein